MPRIRKRDDGRPWFADGLRFACQGCGRCCGGAPGYVWLTKDEGVRIAEYLGMASKAFRRRYVRRAWRGLTLKEKPNDDCIMLDGGGRCRIYPVRPLQCRIWPFWPENLASPRAWEAAAARCPGIGRGPLFTFEQIEALRHAMEG